MNIFANEFSVIFQISGSKHDGAKIKSMIFHHMAAEKTILIFLTFNVIWNLMWDRKSFLQKTETIHANVLLFRLRCHISEWEIHSFLGFELFHFAFQLSLLILSFMLFRESPLQRTHSEYVTFDDLIATDYQYIDLKCVWMCASIRMANARLAYRLHTELDMCVYQCMNDRVYAERT